MPRNTHHSHKTVEQYRQHYNVAQLGKDLVPWGLELNDRRHIDDVGHDEASESNKKLTLLDSLCNYNILHIGKIYNSRIFRLR